MGTALAVTPLATALGVVIGVILAVGLRSIVVELRRRRRDAAVTHLLSTFAPAIEHVREDPRRLLVWYPLASGARRLFPDAFAELDGAVGGTFPFTTGQLQDAHDRCTADWLAWERSHDFDYKLRASVAEQELEEQGQLQTSLGKARLEAIEREKLERYQARYAEYVHVAKALAGLGQAAADGAPPDAASAR